MAHVNLDTIIYSLNNNNGLITAIATTVLVIVTYFYLLETRKLRKLNEQLLKVDNTLLTIETRYAEENKETASIELEVYFKNIGTKPARAIEFKILTKRSPRECISDFIFNGSREDDKTTKTKIYTKFKDALMPGESTIFFCKIPLRLLDYDNSFYLWVKYNDFFGERKNEIRHIKLNNGRMGSETFISRIQEQTHKSVKLPITYY